MTDHHEDGHAEEPNLQERVSLIHEHLNTCYEYWALKKAMKDEVVKVKYKASDIQETLPKIMKDLGMEIQIKNKINELYQNLMSVDSGHPLAPALANGLDTRKPIPPLPQYFTQTHFEPIEVIDVARREWSHFLKTRLINFSMDNEKPFIKLRQEPWIWAKPMDSHEEQAQGDQETERLEVRQYEIPCLFDDKAFLSTLLGITSTNYKISGVEWGSVGVHLRTSPIDLIRTEYEEMDVTNKQIGLDEDRLFIEERTNQGEKLLGMDYTPYLKQFAKRGIPSTLRNRIYSKVLEVSMTPKDSAYFAHLLDQCQTWELSIDNMMLDDIRECSNDDKFFVFQETLEKMIFSLLRDPWVSENCRVLPNIPLHGFTDQYTEIGKIPPAGIVPFKLFSRYGAPFTFISEKEEECYFIFRNFYCKYLCYLHSITSDERGILSLCRLFEDILQTYDSELVYHLNRIGVQPLQIAFPWIYYSFVGYLEVEQIYLLWDRIIGYDSLDVLALVAVALFVYRGDMILQTNSLEDIEDLFYDLSQIQVVPLLQHFLFVEKNVIQFQNKLAIIKSIIAWGSSPTKFLAFVACSSVNPAIKTSYIGSGALQL